MYTQCERVISDFSLKKWEEETVGSVAKKQTKPYATLVYRPPVIWINVIIGPTIVKAIAKLGDMADNIVP